MKLYQTAFSASFGHALSAFLRRRRTLVVFVLLLLPALVPLTIPFLPRSNEDTVSPDWILTQMIEIFYVFGVTPLLALFFAAMLVGEDVESHTISYILTRPVPRTAWVLGRFCAYLVVCSGLIAASIVAMRLSVQPLAQKDGLSVSLGMLLQYQGAAVMSLVGYGALCAYLSARLRHPVVVGALIIFGWQRLAMIAPGMADSLTIHKYVAVLLPGGGRNALAPFEGLASEFIRSDVNVAPWAGVLVLFTFAALCLALAGDTVRKREYTTPVAVTE